MEIVSGRTGKPHVTSQQFRQLIEGTVGQESCILTSGENLEPELASNNSLKIRSGMLAHHGNISSVKIGTYDEVGLSNGSQGMKRIDLVVCRYTKNAETEVENCDWVVIMGTPAASNPVAPAYTVGNLQDGDLVDDCPIFEVHYDGINVTEVKKLVPVVSNLTELNSKLKILKTEYIAVNSFESSSTLYSDIDFGKECAGCYTVGTILAVNRTPWTSSNWAMFRGCKLDENGRGRIYCVGSSFVNGHGLGCFVMAAK